MDVMEIFVWQEHRGIDKGRLIHVWLLHVCLTKDL